MSLPPTWSEGWVDVQVERHFDRIAGAAKMYHCEETVLFYHDILQWDQRPSLAAFKRMGERYVREGGEFEHGALSDQLRRQWLEGDIEAVSIVKHLLYLELRLNPIFANMLIATPRPRRLTPTGSALLAAIRSG